MPTVSEFSASSSGCTGTIIGPRTSCSVSTVQRWEIGEKKPSGPSLKLLNVIDKKGVDALV
jgi:hypothetical protein